MKYIFKTIGCRAGSPADGIPASGYLLKGPGGNVLIDCGPGVAVNIRPEEIENLIGVIISHQHADHVLDVMALAYYQLFPGLRKRLPLFGPSSLAEVLRKYDELFGIASLPSLRNPIATAFDFRAVVPEEPFSIGPYSFDTLNTEHPVDTIALRSERPRFVYSSDGAYTEQLEDFCRGTSLLIAEATYLEGGSQSLDEHGHMTADICGSLAEAAGVEHLLITHLADQGNSGGTLVAAKRTFHGTITIARPGLEIVCSEG